MRDTPLRLRRWATMTLLAMSAACGSSADDGGGGGLGPSATALPTPAPTSSGPPTPLPSDAPEWNVGWIGGACDSAGDCSFDASICLTPDDGYPNGYCAQSCDRFCPDRDLPNHTVTFCVEEGHCASRCMMGCLSGGCRTGYQCSWEPRRSDPGVYAAACLPPALAADPYEADICQASLADHACFEPQHWPDRSPDTHPGLTCHVESPLRLQPEILGIGLRYFEHEVGSPPLVGCRLAAAIVQMMTLLQEYDVVEVIHMGTYNCRVIAGTDTLSEHGDGNALDIYGFALRDGRTITLVDHWEHDTDQPQTPEGQILYEIAHRLHDEQVFNIILTPNFPNHDNHFHVDMTAGAHSLLGEGSGFYIGPNLTGD